MFDHLTISPVGTARSGAAREITAKYIIAGKRSTHVEDVNVPMLYSPKTFGRHAMLIERPDRDTLVLLCEDEEEREVLDEIAASIFAVADEPSDEDSS